MMTNRDLCKVCILVLWVIVLHGTLPVVAVTAKSSSSVDGAGKGQELANPDGEYGSEYRKRQPQQLQRRRTCSSVEQRKHPALCHMLDRVENDIENLASEIYAWAKQNRLLVDVVDDEDFTEVRSLSSSSSGLRHQQQQQQEQQTPVVLAHGMGDSCFNDGMKSVTTLVSKLLDGVYTVCIPTGSTQAEDTSNGYFLNMDASVDVFAQAIQNDVVLSKISTLHAIGFSQGNNIIRGYIAKYNNPPVHTFISVNGVNAGVGAVPYCIPSSSLSTVTTASRRDLAAANDDESIAQMFYQNNDHKHSDSVTSIGTVFSICELLMEQASKQAYTEFAQEHSFQANYWRDPRKSIRSLYEKYSQLATWNNEVRSTAADGSFIINETLRINWARTNKFVWIEALEDTMVWPKEGEQWGQPNSNVNDPFASPILPYNETDWYIRDLFGLRSAEQLGKNVYESFQGDHLQFSTTDFKRWIVTYLGQGTTE